MERERYIGVSGVSPVKSSLYLTLGISGQIQHMVVETAQNYCRNKQR